jgi:hypothetical protein
MTALFYDLLKPAGRSKGITHPNCRLVPYSDLNEVQSWIRNNLFQ